MILQKPTYVVERHTSFPDLQGIIPEGFALQIFPARSREPTILYYPSLAFFFITFPDGRVVPRWAWALIFLWVMNVFFWTVGGVDVHSPFAIGNWGPFLEAGWLSLVFGGSAGVQLYRFLHLASPLQRQQIK